MVAIGEAKKRHRTFLISQMLLNNPFLLKPQHTHKGLAAILDIKNADIIPILSRLIEEKGGSWKEHDSVFTFAPNYCI